MAGGVCYISIYDFKAMDGKLAVNVHKSHRFQVSINGLIATKYHKRTPGGHYALGRSRRESKH